MIEEITNAIGRWKEGARARAKLRAELEALEAKGELDIVLAEAGLTRSQLNLMVAGHPDAGQLLTSMLDRLRLDRSVIPADTIREMGWACTICDDKRRCREWLADGEEGGYRAFCPNTLQLDYASLKQNRGAS